ncbi:2-methylisocitrate lyase-like PEP mutase family enzyme [Scopulibacillus daqui]|uniref:2-methylisocitrate lyase-like PEP mutase family enzyme n=1 Tax=Scopulibacillus daqui TaxID=1469162 RepID=A0ABS2PX33_9BACL|nr:isocitrate lyase/phosphoenolpyruvate mutase family protein [Scopulibacillus daqui]MBM7644585.1 2-methylisocitrate lyase-like PEP mutase family enzyme [Scopulibacillus daqui]
MDTLDRGQKAEKFFQLHQRNSIFVLPNAWDAMSAKMFEGCGFEAIGTTSAGIAASLGFRDGQNMTFEQMIESISHIASSVNVPVSADIESGYGSTINEVLNHVKKVIEAGAVGINIEDGTGDPAHPIFDASVQKEKIKAIKEFSNSNDMPLFINARIDMYWLNIGDDSQRYKETIKRAQAYQEAGADCIFIPGLDDLEIIRSLRELISCPINLLVSPKLPSIAELSKMGIERVSCGSAPFRSTVTLLKKISEEIIDEGTFHLLTDDVIPYRKINDLI